jgi:hypothetical protein
MSTRFLLMGCVIASLTLSCATAPVPDPTPPVPDWAASPSAIRAVYPDSDFIAQRGARRDTRSGGTCGGGDRAVF